VAFFSLFLSLLPPFFAVFGAFTAEWAAKAISFPCRRPQIMKVPPFSSFLQCARERHEKKETAALGHFFFPPFRIRGRQTDRAKAASLSSFPAGARGQMWEKGGED